MTAMCAVAALTYLAVPAMAMDGACLCLAIKNHLKPKKVNGKWQVQQLNPQQLEAFAEAAQACGSGSGYRNCDGMGVRYDVNADGDTSDAVASGNYALTLAIGGDSTGGAQNGGTATSTNTGAGGAAVAVGGAGTESPISSGGSANAACTNVNGGGDAVANGGEGGDPLNDDDQGGNGGSATATSTGFGSATGLQGEGESASEGPPATPGTHGTGATASVGSNGPSATDGSSTPNTTP